MEIAQASCELHSRRGGRSRVSMDRERKIWWGPTEDE